MGDEATVANGRWRFDKTISLGTLIAVFSVIVGIGGPILLWGRTMETRVQIIETTQDQKAKIDAAQAAELREQQKEFLSRMDKFSEQVTQLRITLGGPVRK